MEGRKSKNKQPPNIPSLAARESRDALLNSRQKSVSRPPRNPDKSGQTSASDYLQGLTYSRFLPDQANARAALVYGGDVSYMRQGVAVLSWQHWE